VAEEKDVRVHDSPSSFKAAPEEFTLADLQKANERYWNQNGGEFYPNHHYGEVKKGPMQ
jgi:hypothetical protein